MAGRKLNRSEYGGTGFKLGLGLGLADMGNVRDSIIVRRAGQRRSHCSHELVSMNVEDS